MNSTIKKQNRVLLGALIVLLTAAVILIAVTGSANRNRKNETPQNEAGTVPDENSDTLPSVTEKSITDEKSALPEKDGKKSNKSDISEKTDDSADTSGGTDGILDEENGTHDDAEVSAMQNDVLPTFSAPVDNFVIKGYSADIPVFSHTMNDYRIHRGVDIACSVGTPVCAAADGTVCEVYSDPMMGFTVGVSHSGGALTRYRGLSEDSASLVSIGDEVTRGQVIGASGETALIESAEEAHVHFELTVNGEPADPAEYMSLSYLSDVYEG